MISQDTTSTLHQQLGSSQPRAARVPAHCTGQGQSQGDQTYPRDGDQQTQFLSWSGAHTRSHVDPSYQACESASVFPIWI